MCASAMLYKFVFYTILVNTIAQDFTLRIDFRTVWLLRQCSKVLLVFRKGQIMALFIFVL